MLIKDVVRRASASWSDTESCSVGYSRHIHGVGPLPRWVVDAAVVLRQAFCALYWLSVWTYFFSS